MRILLLVHGFNALSQRLHTELREAGHEVSVEFDISEATTIEAVRLAAPSTVATARAGPHWASTAPGAPDKPAISRSSCQPPMLSIPPACPSAPAMMR